VTRPDDPEARLTWTRNPIERARFLDGEGDPAEREAREASLRDDPEARESVRLDGAFLGAMRRAGAAVLPPEPARVAALTARVREALAADRETEAPILAMPSRRGRRIAWASAAAAVAAAAVGLAFFRPKPTSAADEGVLLAARTLRMAMQGSVPADPDGCKEGPDSPYRFPPIAEKELALQGCARKAEGGAVVAVLEGDAKDGAAKASPRSLVAVAWPQGRGGPEIGVTYVDEVVVFDVGLGGAKYYLATPLETIQARGQCFACHGTSREGKANPHVFRERGAVH
jgi:hypothetical protein